MAVKLENKVNIDAPDATWPFGNTRNNTGANDGTPYDQPTMTDYIQFFHKMMLESGIAYNDIVDNETNGWQFFLALVENIKQTILNGTDLVTTLSIQANAVTNAKIANNAVDSGKLANSSVITSKIASDAVTWDKVATPLTSSITEAFVGSMTNELARRTSAGATQLLGTCNRGLSGLPTVLGTINTTGSNNRPTTKTLSICSSVDGLKTCVLEIETTGVVTMLSGDASTEFDMTGCMYISN